MYVGSETCNECHEELYTNYTQTGHAHALTRIVDGAAPEFPFTEVENPPEGVAWADVLYVIGGYGWKALFVDQNGNVITGYLLGAQVHEAGKLVDPATLEFAGSIRLMPATA